MPEMKLQVKLGNFNKPAEVLIISSLTSPEVIAKELETTDFPPAIFLIAGIDIYNQDINADSYYCYILHTHNVTDKSVIEVFADQRVTKTIYVYMIEGWQSNLSLRQQVIIESEIAKRKELSLGAVAVEFLDEIDEALNVNGM